MHSMWMACTSNMVRTLSHAMLIQVFTEHMVTLSLSGYMFFGSALAVSDRVLHVRLMCALLDCHCESVPLGASRYLFQCVGTACMQIETTVMS
jgi:hypothetical protein